MCICVCYIDVYSILHMYMLHYLMDTYIYYIFNIYMDIYTCDGMLHIHSECLCSPKMNMLRPNPQCDSIRSWDLCEGIRS